MKNSLNKKRLEAKRQRMLEKNRSSTKRGALVSDLAKIKSLGSQRKEIMGGIRRKYAGGVKSTTSRQAAISNKQTISVVKPTTEEVVKRRQNEQINSNRTCVINQSGLSEIIFCEPIAQMYYKDNYKVIWPIETRLLNNINKHFPHITFVDKSLVNVNYEDRQFRNINDALYVPLQWSEDIMKSQNMSSKYDLFNLPVETWKTSSWVRDTKSEQELFYDILMLELDEPYNLISNKFIACNWQSSNGLRNVFVEAISDYSLIDWSMVIENATNIYTVESAINYIIELTNIKAKEYQMVSQTKTNLFSKPRIVGDR